MKNVAVIGYGGQGAWHCSQIADSDVVTLSGIYDVKEARRRAAENNGIHVYSSNEEIFDDKNVDIVVVATPNDVHLELVKKALLSGHNVICEKPVALSVKDFEEMLNAEKESGKRLSVHQNRRWDVDYLAVKNVIESKNIGDVLRIESHIMGSRGIPSDWRGNKEYGGGMLYDWGVHLIDQMLMLIPEKITSVNCVTTHYTNDEVDDGFRLELGFISGKTALIEVGTYNFISTHRFYMLCKEGTMLHPNWRVKGKVAKLKKWVEKDVTPIQNAAGITKTMAHRDEKTLDYYEVEIPNADVHDFYRNFCDSIDMKCEQFIKNSEVKRVLSVIEAAFLSDESKQIIHTLI